MMEVRFVLLLIATVLIFPGLAAGKDDQAHLAVIAQKATNEAKGKAALAAITDQRLLAAVAIAGRRWDVRQEAARRVTDPAILTGIAMETREEVFGSSYAFKAAEAIGKADQSLVATIARGAKDAEWRRVAISVSTDVQILSSIALDTQNLAEARREAVERLAGLGNSGAALDQAVMSKIPLADKGVQARTWDAIHNSPIPSPSSEELRALMRQLAIPDEATQAAISLSKLGASAAPAIMPLLNLLGDPDGWNQRYKNLFASYGPNPPKEIRVPVGWGTAPDRGLEAAKALIAIGQPAVDWLVLTLVRGGTLSACRAAFALRAINTARSQDALADFREHIAQRDGVRSPYKLLAYGDGGYDPCNRW